MLPSLIIIVLLAVSDDAATYTPDDVYHLVWNDCIITDQFSNVTTAMENFGSCAVENERSPKTQSADIPGYLKFNENFEGATCFQMAVAFGRKHLVQLMIKEGVNVSQV